MLADLPACRPFAKMTQKRVALHLGWGDVYLYAPLPALFCLGRWDMGRFGMVPGQDGGGTDKSPDPVLCSIKVAHCMGGQNARHCGRGAGLCRVRLLPSPSRLSRVPSVTISLLSGPSLPFDREAILMDPTNKCRIEPPFYALPAAGPAERASEGSCRCRLHHQFSRLHRAASAICFPGGKEASKKALLSLGNASRLLLSI